MSHRFTRDLELDRRIRANADDAFQARAFDFPLPLLTDCAIHALTAALVRGHDGLRTRVRYAVDGILGAENLDGDPAVCIAEIRSLTEEVEPCDKFLQRQRRAINLLEGPLAVFHYFRSQPENRGILRLLCSHFSVDLGSQRILARAIAGLAAGNSESSTIGSGYLDWMNAYFQYASGEAGLREAEFWLSSAAGPIGAAKAVLACASGPHASQTVLEIPESVLLALQESCRRRWNCRAAEAIVAAAALAIGAELGLETIPFTWTTHGRHPLSGRHFARTTGWLSNLHPVLISLAAGEKAGLVASLRQSLSALPNGGCSFPWVARFAATSETERLAAPFRINLRESSFRPAARQLGHETRFEEPSIIVEPLPPRASGQPHLHLVVDLKRSVRVALKFACGKSPDTGPRIARALAEHLYAYAFAESRPA